MSESRAPAPLPPILDTPVGEHFLLALVDVVRGLAYLGEAAPDDAAPATPSRRSPSRTGQEKTASAR